MYKYNILYRRVCIFWYTFLCDISCVCHCVFHIYKYIFIQQYTACNLMCIYICMYVCMHVYIYTLIYTYIYTYVRIFIDLKFGCKTPSTSRWIWERETSFNLSIHPRPIWAPGMQDGVGTILTLTASNGLFDLPKMWPLAYANQLKPNGRTNSFVDPWLSACPL